MAAAVAAGSAALSAYGDIQQGKMTADSLNKQADSLIAQGAEAEAKGQTDAMRQQIIASQRIGTSVAAYGASGVTATSGSVLDVVQASHQNAELDRLNILHGADIRNLNYINQAAMNRFGANSAIQGSYWRALGDLTMGAVKGGTSSTAAKPTGGGEGTGLEGNSAGAGEDAGLESGASAAGEEAMLA